MLYTKYGTQKGLTFDDVLLVPQYFDLDSRSQVDLTTKLGNIVLDLPIVSANMDTVTEHQMAETMALNGGLGILHRYALKDAVLTWIKLVAPHYSVVPSIGIKDEDLDKAVEYDEAGASAICIDVAHGYTKATGKMVQALALKNIPVIAGNVATADGVKFLVDNGAKVVKVGIGPGSMCTTRVVTGHGIPQLQAISAAYQIKQHENHGFDIIADGGIRSAGDIVKALAFGADAVMVGSLLSATSDTPGTPNVGIDGNQYKIYRGMASSDAQNAFRGSVGNGAPEGVAVYKPYRGETVDVLKELAGGIRSGLSYSGAHSLKHLRNKALYVEMTQAGYNESIPHGVK